MGELVTEHSPGVLNALADALSRLHQPGHAGELPEQLQGARRKHIDLHVDSCWQAWTASACHPRPSVALYAAGSGPSAGVPVTSKGRDSGSRLPAQTCAEQGS